MAAFTKRKQALHDIITSSLVIKDPEREPKIGQAIGASILALLLFIVMSAAYMKYFVVPSMSKAAKNMLDDLDVSFNVTPPAGEGEPFEGRITVKIKGKETTFDLGKGTAAEKPAVGIVKPIALLDKKKKDEVYRYYTRNRRDPFRALLTKQIVKEEERKKRDAESEKLRKEMEQTQEAELDLETILGELFPAGSQVIAPPPQPQVSFPDVEISGIMWDPYDPVLTLVGDNTIFRQGDLVSQEDGFTYVVEIFPDSITIEKNQDGRRKRKHIGIIRVEEDFSQWIKNLLP